MMLSDARKIAKDIVGHSVAFPHRNVWVFYDYEGGDLIITKDNASVNRSGVFRSNSERNEFIDISSGESVLFEDVFGKPFFEDNPDLLIDNMTSGIVDLEDKIDALAEQTEDLLRKTNTSMAAMFMVEDLIEDYDEIAYKRLVVLNNYLSSCDTDIGMEDFTYLHHELFSLQ